MMRTAKTLDHYLAEWDLANPRLLNQTMTSRLYTVNHHADIVVLKVLEATETDERRGAAALRHFAGQGAVRLLRWDEGAHLLEYAAGDELVTLVERGDDAEATRVIAQVIEQLHGAPPPPPGEGLVRLEHWFRALFRQADADREAGRESIYRRGAAVAERLLATQRDIRVLHGDIHHRNIRSSARGWLAFDPKGLVGERTYDCANTLCNPVIPALVHNRERLLTQATILAEALGLALPRVLAFTFAYACLNASWWIALNGPDIVAWSLSVARIVEPLLEPE